MKPGKPINEKKRLNALKKYEILDTDKEEIYDSITKLVANICNVPICLISLIDENRQWFKSKYGLDAIETPRDVSFCGHAINQTEIFCIEDSTKDDRFKDNPLVTGEPNVIFYAGKPLVDNNGFALGTLCVIDNKPRKLTETQLEQLKILSEQVVYLIQLKKQAKTSTNTIKLLSKLSKNLPGFIYTYKLNPDGSSCFPYSSQMIYSIYEVTPEEVKQDATVVFSRVHEDDLNRVAETIKKSYETMTKWNCDYRVNLPIQGEKWVRGSANPEKISDGSVLWHGYITDISDIKRNEHIANISSKMASLGEMASGIAHEINNPLAIIKTSAAHMGSLVKRQDYSQDKFIKNIERINLTVDRISKIVKGLRFFSTTMQDNHFKMDSVANLLDDTLSLCSEKFKINGVELKIKTPENFKEIQIECRAVEISQVLLNLMNNSFDAILNLPERWIEIEIRPEAQSMIFSITDSGSGISKEHVNKVLTPFFTTKVAGKGTGLGLSISQKIIYSHAGKLWIDNKCPHTRFVFEIPIKQSVLNSAA
jgi:nitrogen-specific signal transduction histidine kinase